MEAEQKAGWNIFKQIFSDHWEGFQERNPLYDKPYYNDLVEKMLGERFSLGIKPMPYLYGFK